jgi:hypothetical protein
MSMLAPPYLVLLLLCGTVTVNAQSLTPSPWHPQPGDMVSVDPTGNFVPVAGPCAPANLVRLLDAVLAHPAPPDTPLSLEHSGTGYLSPSIPDLRSEAERWRDSAVAHERDAARARAWADEIERQERVRAEARQVVERCKQ